MAIRGSLEYGLCLVFLGRGLAGGAGQGFIVQPESGWGVHEDYRAPDSQQPLPSLGELALQTAASSN